MLLLLVSIPLMIVGVALALLPLSLVLARQSRAGRPTPAEIHSAAAEVRTEDETHSEQLRRALAAAEAATRQADRERVLVSA